MKLFTIGLLLACLTVPAGAQRHQKSPKARPRNANETRAKDSSRPVKLASGNSSTAKELRKIEQSSAKTVATHDARQARASRSTAALRAEKEGRNPSIHPTSGEAKANKGKKNTHSAKGRLRHKGSRR